jgi:hypothetical protein
MEPINGPNNQNQEIKLFFDEEAKRDAKLYATMIAIMFAIDAFLIFMSTHTGNVGVIMAPFVILVVLITVLMFLWSVVNLLFIAGVALFAILFEKNRS